MKRRLSLPLLLCAVLLVYALTTPTSELIQEPAPTEPGVRIPHSYAHGVSLLAYDAQGELLDRTEATTLNRFAETAVVEMIRPQRWGHRGTQDWVASATLGTLYERRDTLRLHGDVQLSYATEEVTFATQSMEIDLRQQIARSLAPVRAWQGENETRAQQLVVNLNNERATLSGNVRSVYVPGT